MVYFFFQEGQNFSTMKFDLFENSNDHIIILDNVHIQYDEQDK